MKNVKNRLRVSHFPQIPCEPFSVEVRNEREAYFISETLANQHLFLFKNRMIPDYSNVILVEMWDEDSDGEGKPDWVDYYNDEEFMDWGEFVETYLTELA